MQEVWVEYVERLAGLVQAGAKTAELLYHRGERGAAREAVLREFLGAFLPETVGVGSGEVFDRSGGRSKQIDLVVYDKAFPIPRLSAEGWLFPVEAVIGTIEVKTALNAETIAEALDNCLSVVRLRPRAAKLFNTAERPRDAAEPLATRQDYDWLYPATYVIAFSSFKKDEARSIAQKIGNWFPEQLASLPDVPYPLMLLPRVVASPSAVWMRRVEDLKLYAGSGLDVHFAATETAQSYHFVVADLLGKIMNRISSARIDARTRQQWIYLAAEDFDISSRLPSGTRWTTGTLHQPCDDVVEVEHVPRVRTGVLGVTMEPKRDDGDCKWVRLDGLLIGCLFHRKDGVMAQYLSDFRMAEGSWEAEFGPLGIVDTEEEAVGLILAKAPSNRFRCVEGGIPVSLAPERGAPECFQVRHGDGRLLGRYCERDGTFAVWVPVPGEPSQVRSHGNVSSKDEAIRELLDHDGLTTGLFP